MSSLFQISSPTTVSNNNKGCVHSSLKRRTTLTRQTNEYFRRCGVVPKGPTPRLKHRHLNLNV